MGLLGSSFFFKRGDIALSDPAALWRTVAFDLAQRDSFFAGRLIENLNEGRVDPTRADIAMHFKHLIKDPLAVSLEKRQATGAIRSPVVVLDALDECGSDPSQSTQMANESSPDHMTRHSVSGISRRDIWFLWDEVPAPFHDNSHMRDGWILGANSESLFWPCIGKLG